MNINSGGVVSWDMSRSRDGIFQSLDAEGLKYQSRLSNLKSPKLGMSLPL